MLNWTDLALMSLAVGPFLLGIIAGLLIDIKLAREEAQWRSFHEETARQIREINEQFDREMVDRRDAKVD